MILGKTVNGKIANVAIYNGSRVILHDSVSVNDINGIDVLENVYSQITDIIIVFGDKDYMGNATLRRLIVNGDTVSAIYPFGEAKLFSGDKIITWEEVGGQRGMSVKRYIVYDVSTKSIACQFDRQ
jgi:hypothetical protein